VTAFGHPRGVVPGESDARKDVHIEHPSPPVIVDVERGLGVEDADIVDQDVDTRNLVEDAAPRRSC
jgi:hypothetical protein